MKQFVGYLVKKALGKGKVSPTIKSVKPSPTVMKKGLKASIDKTKGDEYIKRIDLRNASEKKIKTGKKLMKEGQKERRTLLDTGRAFQFRNIKSVHALKPGENPKVKYKATIAEDRPEKKFKKGKDLK